MSTRATLRKLFVQPTMRPCPICLVMDQELAWWSDHHRAFIHIDCVPSWIRRHPFDLIQNWLDTGQPPSLGLEVETQVSQVETKVNIAARPGRTD